MKLFQKLVIFITYFILVTFRSSSSLFKSFDHNFNYRGYRDLDDEDSVYGSGNGPETDNSFIIDVTSTTAVTTTTEGDGNENGTKFTEVTSTTLATSTSSPSTSNTVTSKFNELSSLASSNATDLHTISTEEFSTYSTSTTKEEIKAESQISTLLATQSTTLATSTTGQEKKIESQASSHSAMQSTTQIDSSTSADDFTHTETNIITSITTDTLTQAANQTKAQTEIQTTTQVPKQSLIQPKSQPKSQAKPKVQAKPKQQEKPKPKPQPQPKSKQIKPRPRPPPLSQTQQHSEHLVNRTYQAFHSLPDVDIKVYPETQDIYEGQEVVIRCRDEGKKRLPVKWSRTDGKTLPWGSTDRDGRLTMPNIVVTYNGPFKCSPLDSRYNSMSKLSYLNVLPSNQRGSKSIIPLFAPCAQNYFPCNDRECIPLNYFCDGEYDCKDKSDERNCESQCRPGEFQCGDGNCISSQKRCDQKIHCVDRSDEANCYGNPFQPQVFIDPPFYEAKRGENVRFDCKGSGNPPPRVQWTPGVLSTSEFNINGTVLTLLSVSEASQGTYTCHVFNNFGHAQAQVELKVSSSDAPFRLRIHPPRYDVGDGQGVRFDCENLDSSDAIYEWKFKRHGGSGEEELPLGVQELGSALIIRSASRNHAGSYICKSISTLGTGETQAVLTVDSGASSLGSYPYSPSQSYNYPPNYPYPQYPSQHQPQNQVEIYPQSQTSRLGDTARFECRAAGFQKSNIKWTRSDGNLPEGVIVDNAILTIPSVNEDHAGIYICEIEGPNGPVRNQARLITAPAGHPGHPGHSGYPGYSGHPSYPSRDESSGDYRNLYEPSLSVEIEPQRQTVVQGETGTLKCIIRSGAAGPISWSKVNGELSDRHKTEGDTLRIENTVIDDRGLYVCKVESGVSSAQSSAIVEIERREAPIIELFPQPVQKVQVGSSALFQCRLLAGIPSPVIKWSRENDKPITSNTELMDGGVIRFNQLTGEEEGKYKCVAENLAGQASVDATLVVEPRMQPLYPSPHSSHPSYPTYPLHPAHSSSGSQPGSSSNSPSTAIRIRQPNPYQVPLGEEAMLECMAHDEPAPMVEWKRYNSERPLTLATETSSIYKIPQVSHADTGEYVCVATTPKGTAEEKIYLAVLEPSREGPRDSYPHHPNNPSQSSYSHHPNNRGVLPDGRDLVVQPGGRADFQCALREEIEGATIEWNRENAPMPQNSRVDKEVLYIDDVRPEDEGIYVCTGRMGPSVLFQDKVRLNVVDGPTIHLNPTVQAARPGDNVYVDCVAQGPGPVTISWSKEGKELPSSVIQSDGRLQFRNIQFTDSGRYMCTARGPNGVAEGVAEVMVRNEVGDPRMPIPPRKPMGKEQTISPNTDARMRCDFSHIPNARISWTYDTQPLPFNSQIQNDELIVYNAQHSNAGRYICNAEVAGRIVDRDYVILNIRDSAAVPLPEGAAPEDSYYCDSFNQFRCRDGTCIDSRRQCDQRTDCSDGSDEANCPTTQSPPPDVKVLIIANKDKVHLNDNLMLQCIVSNGSVTGFEWSKESSFPDNVLTESNALNIKGVRTENGGVYTCHVATDLGQFSNDYVLTIQPPLSNTEPVQTISVPFGTQATLTCDNPLEEPVSYAWYKMHSLNSYDRPIVSSSNGDVIVQDKRLILRNVDEQSTGTYECLARNAETNYKVETILVVTGVIPQFEQYPLSYMQLPTLENSGIELDIELSIKPEKPDGMILYNGQAPQTGDFVLVGLKDGYIEYKYELGDGVVSIRSDEPISMNEWHKIRISKYRQDGTLQVDNQIPVNGRSPGSYDELNLQEMLYVGGIPDKNLLSKEVDIHDGFVGCISLFKIKDKEINLLKEATSHGIKVCEACLHNKCSTGGICQEALTDNGYNCICSKGFYGQYCEESEHREPPPQFCENVSCRNGGTCISTNDNFICNCQPGFSGALCENEEPACRNQPCQNFGLCSQKDDQIFCCCKFGFRGDRCEFEEKIPEESPLRFIGKSYATLHKDIFPHDEIEAEEIIELKFKTNQTHGLIFYHGQPSTEPGIHQDFLGVSIENGFLQFTWDLGHGPAVIESDFLVNDEKPHNIMVTRKGNQGSLIIDNRKPFFGESPGPVDKLDTLGDIYIGGLPDYSLMTGYKYKHGFIGCIDNVVVSGITTEMKYDSLLTCNVLACGDM